MLRLRALGVVPMFTKADLLWEGVGQRKDARDGGFVIGKGHFLGLVKERGSWVKGGEFGRKKGGLFFGLSRVR